MRGKANEGNMKWMQVLFEAPVPAFLVALKARASFQATPLKRNYANYLYAASGCGIATAATAVRKPSLCSKTVFVSSSSTKTVVPCFTTGQPLLESEEPSIKVVAILVEADGWSHQWAGVVPWVAV